MAFLPFVRIVGLACALHLERLKYAYVALLVVLIVLGGGIWGVLFAASSGFPAGTILMVAPGESVGKVARELKAERVIASPFVFRVLFRLMPGTHGVQSGRYVFNKPAGIVEVAWHLGHGVTGIAPLRVTVPEGTAVEQMAYIVAAAVPDFDIRAFLALAKPHEGYLFPDTYFLSADATPEEVITRMKENYRTHIARFSDRIQTSGKTEEEIITMASLLEGEGKTLEGKRIIAGILWKRLTIGMALQVDAPFGYARGVAGYAPTATDLKSASPYNTYTHPGLPPTPINNPGDESILAALTPTASEYLYYLTGTDGTMRYARTLAEHADNQRKYLK